MKADEDDVSAVVTKQKSDIGDIQLDVTWTQGGGNTALGATFFDNICLTDASGDTYAFNSAGVLVLASPAEGAVKEKQMRATISYAGTNSNLAAVVGDWTATVNKTERLRLNDTVSVWTDEDITFDFTIALQNPNADWASGTNEYQISLTYVDFYVMIDGSNEVEETETPDDEEDGVTGTLSLSIEAAE